jgi:hypothetical protein
MGSGSRLSLFLTLWSLILTPDVRCNSLATLDADTKRLRLDVVTIQRSPRTAVFSWRLWRQRAQTCLVTWKRLKSRLIVEGWTFKLLCYILLTTSDSMHPNCSDTSFSEISGRFPIWIFCNLSAVFVCTHVRNDTPVDVYCQSACDQPWPFSKKCKMLIENVMWHIM